jgi:uncharacterized protein (DUF433 family)
MATTSSTRPTEYAHIVCTPGFLGGEPWINGHRIRVRDVVAALDVNGLSAEAIVQDCYPTLTLAEVYAALAYYEDHRPEIEAFQQVEAEFVERFARENPTTVRDLRSKGEL